MGEIRVLTGTKGIGIPSKPDGGGGPTLDIHIESDATLVSWLVSSGPTDPGSPDPNQQFSILLKAGDYRLLINNPATSPSGFPCILKTDPDPSQIT